MKWISYKRRCRGSNLCKWRQHVRKIYRGWEKRFSASMISMLSRLLNLRHRHLKPALNRSYRKLKTSLKHRLNKPQLLKRQRSSALHHIASYKASRTIPAMAKGWILRNITMLYVTLRNKPASMNPALYRKRR